MGKKAALIELPMVELTVVQLVGPKLVLVGPREVEQPVDLVEILALAGVGALAPPLGVELAREAGVHLRKPAWVWVFESVAASAPAYQRLERQLPHR